MGKWNGVGIWWAFVSGSPNHDQHHNLFPSGQTLGLSFPESPAPLRVLLFCVRDRFAHHLEELGLAVIERVNEGHALVLWVRVL